MAVSESNAPRTRTTSATSIIRRSSFLSEESRFTRRRDRIPLPYPERRATLSQQATERFGRIYRWSEYKRTFTELVSSLIAE